MVSQHFDLVVNDDFCYTKTDCYYTDQWDSHAQQCRDQGIKVVIDNLWERCTDRWQHHNCWVLQNPAWFWYQESLWYRHLQYDLYQPACNWAYKVLMPMRKANRTRNFALKLIENHISDFLWSYQEHGRDLPNSETMYEITSQRQFRSEWYDSTAMSLVMESLASSDENLIFVTEKSFKPMAFFHPFVICGPKGSLAYLRSLGFVTFDNMFDESYDRIQPWTMRVHQAITQCLSYKVGARDSITQEKLKHNHNHFFDQKLVISRIVTDILDPLSHYAET